MKNIKALWPYVRRYRWRLLLALVGTGLVTLLGVLPPLLYRFLFDKVVRPQAWQLLVPALGAIVIAGLMSLCIQFVNTRILMSAAYQLLKDLRLDMYRQILQLGMRYHSSLSAGAITARLMGDVSALQTLITTSTIQILVDLVIFIFSVTVAFTISTKLACILLIIVALYVIAYKYFVRPIRGANIAYRRQLDRLAGRLQETLRGVRHVRIYNREDHERELFAGHATDTMESSLTATMSTVGLSVTCSLVSGYGSTIIAGLGAWFVLHGEMSYGDIWAMDHYVWLAITPAVRLANVAANLAATFVSVERIVEVLNEQPSIVSAPGAPRMEPGPGTVSFRNVFFSYAPEKPMFRGFSLEVESGSMVALVGHTGCGKTTVTNLLMRHWDIQAGEILVNGVDIHSVDLNSLRRLFGVVLQDPVLFEGTLAENIAYGLPTAPRDAIEEAARAAEIFGMATALPQGFDTVIGSRGVTLSLGEKQRVSIARAILREPEILIMDEATSALDSQSEDLIQTALARVLKGRTSFVVAHRLSTITEADLIVVMDDGCIVEQGTFRWLKHKPGGHFRRLYGQLRSKEQSA